MRCICCNTELTDREATLRHAETGQYLDMCSGCLVEVMTMAPLTVKGRGEGVIVDAVILDKYDDTH